MTDHPITPPRELVQQWSSEPEYGTLGRATLHTISEQRLSQLLTRSSQWGYDQRGEVNEAKLRQARDQELEACCEWLRREYGYGAELADRLRAARRPKQSLKEQAMSLIDDCTDSHGDDLDDDILGGYLDNNALSIIRCALEALPND